MKVAGLIYVTGPMGAGKSLFGTRRILNTIMRGRYVLTNIQLLDGWARKLAWHTPQGFIKWLFWLIGIRRPFDKQVAFYESLYIHETNLERATAFKPWGKRESGADLVWDELQRDMNNRTWFMENQNYVNAWATHLRKLGFAAFFLAQHVDNTDAALRRIMNFQVRLRNQRQLVRVLGMRLPFDFFLAHWLPANVKKLKNEDVIRLERYFRGWESRCYDTHAVHYDVEDDTLLGIATIQLPKPGTLTPEELRQMRAEWTLQYRQRQADREEASTNGKGVTNGNGHKSSAPAIEALLGQGAVSLRPTSASRRKPTDP